MAPSPDPSSVWRLKPGHPEFTGPVADDVSDLAVVRRIRDAGLTGGDLTQVWTP